MPGKNNDEWTTAGENTFAEANLARVMDYLEETDCVVVEHWHYRGACSPTRLVFDDFEDFREYLQEQTSPGDAIDV